MPQPLSKLPQIKRTSYGVDVVNERPEHMHVSMQIISEAAHSDHWLGNIIVGLHPAEAKPRAAKEFNALENDAKKTASFKAAATALLKDDQIELLEKIVAKHRTASKLRHPFAHHRFGFTPDDEDFLLLIDPRPELLDRAIREKFSIMRDEKSAAEEVASSLDFRASVMAYRLAELHSIRAEIQSATRCLTAFWQLTAKNPPPPVRDAIRAQLERDLQ